MTKTLTCCLLLALSLPAHALAADWAVGAGPAGLASLRAQLPRATVLVPGRTLLVHGARPHVRGAAYVENLGASDRRISFANTEPDAAQQWYLTQDMAWDYWSEPPDLAPVKVAVIDTGIDYDHPEFAGRIAAGAAFAGGSWKRDTCGHGTFVAGEIAANPFNGVGIAGIAFNAQLLIAKVVQPNCNVSTEAEIDGIRWAVHEGARVINLSIGGVRDPVNPELDTFSQAEEDAVEYAYSKGVLVVAAAGNGTQAPRTPWDYADYPAALPHVLGVAAIRQSGMVADYSNRDKLFVDIAAPGGPIFSTIPENLIDRSLSGCVGMPYSNCGPSEFQDGIGTSFAAPQVTAAAALLFGEDPSLTASQVEWLLERSATDADPATGCSICPVGRDEYTGWGDLDITAALELLGNGKQLPPPDAYEPNDTPRYAHPIRAPRTLSATLDFWDDPVDIYSLRLAKGEELFARLGRSTVAPTSLALWKPGTEEVDTSAVAGFRVARSTDVDGQERLAYSAPAAGKYLVEVTIDAPSRAVDAYELSVAVRPPAA